MTEQHKPPPKNETLRLEDHPTKGIFIDFRNKRMGRPTDPQDCQVEDATASLLFEHVGDGIYSRGVIFHGITYSRKIKGLFGPNCFNHEYSNVFITGRDDFFHIFVQPPGIRS